MLDLEKYWMPLNAYYERNEFKSNNGTHVKRSDRAIRVKYCGNPGAFLLIIEREMEENLKYFKFELSKTGIIEMYDK